MTDRKPDIPDINKIKCEDCRYSVDNVNEERPKMRFCAISGHALDIMDKGLPIWGCPIKDAYMHDYASGNDLKRALGHPELQKERELPKAPADTQQAER